MNILSQIRDSAPQRVGNDKTASVDALVANLLEAEHQLRQYIEAEEERTKVRDLHDPRYSLLARSMRERASNLRTTIATLETARAA